MGTEQSVAWAPGAYTDSPEQHPNLILGSLQLLAWIFFHPSAWRHHLQRVDAELRSDFCLAELTAAQWRNPRLRRLLVQACLVWPLMVGLLVGLVLWPAGVPGASIALSVAYAVTLAMATSLAGGLAIGVGVSMAGGAVGGFIAGLVEGAALRVAGRLSFSAAFGMADSPAVSLMNAIGIGVEAGLVGSLVISLASLQSTHSLPRQLGGVVISVLISSAVLFLGGGVVSAIAGEVAGGATDSEVYDLALSMGAGVILGVALGLALGWRTQRWLRDVALGVTAGVVLSAVRWAAAMNDSPLLAVNLGREIAAGVAVAVFFVALFALPYVAAGYTAGPWAGGLAGALGSSGAYVAVAAIRNYDVWPVLPPSLLGIVAGLTFFRWGPLAIYPFVAAWNLLLHRADERRAPANGGASLLRWHSAFWDERQRLPLLGLDEHLLLIMERNPPEGQAASEYLATSHQRWAAQAAQIELDARRLERCEVVEDVSQAHRALAAGELEGPASALLRSFSRLSRDAEAALRQESAYNQRLALSAVEDRLDGLLRELTRSSEPYAVRFRPIAVRWRQIVARHAHGLAQAAEVRQEIENPYIIGVPLTEQQEIFVGRADASAHIEGLLLGRDRSPLLLYGQRRMGKTSLLNNLGRLLPSTIAPLFVDMQGPASLATDEADWALALSRSMADSARRQGLNLSAPGRESLAGGAFARFDEWLDEVERAMDARGQATALLILDEFEALDAALSEGRLSAAAVLGMLRHVIQHRARLKLLLAGSHTLDELHRWASYLINVRVVHISYLKEEEARQLIERPVKDFVLRYEPEASQRVLDLTRGHPFLVQLVCAQVVAFKNEQPPAARRLAGLADVEAVVPRALARGGFFFADIERNQVDLAGLKLLRALADEGEGAAIDRDGLARQVEDPAAVDLALARLSQRELIEPAGSGYRFQVELIRRWFAQPT